MAEIDKMLDTYQDKFNDNFPIMLCRHMDDGEITAIIKKCIADNAPYEPQLDGDANY